MASFTISATLGAATASFSVSPTDARMTELLDDLIAYYDETPALTRAQAAERWINDLGNGQVAFAKGLKQRRLDAEVAEADDLTGA